MIKLSILFFTLIFGCVKNKFEIKEKIFSLDEFKILVKQEDIQEYLLKNEYGLKQKLEEKKETLLHLLLEKKMDVEAIKLLDKLKELEQEKRDEFLKHKDEKGNEALYLAIDRENVEIVDKILELYSEKERNKRLCFEYYIDTILDRAIKTRSAKVMISLVELKNKYRPVDLENSKNYKVRTEIVITDILEEIKRIVEEQEKEESFEREEILLNEEEQKESIILKLIEENIEKRKDKEEGINKENKFKRLIREKKAEILILASYMGDKGVIERYLEQREVNTKDKEGTTLLFLAGDIGHKEIVELLLKKGASIDLAEKSIGATPLYEASANGHKGVVELLIEKDADIDLATNDGATPLLIASERGHKEVVELLIEKGAAIDLAMNDGATPLLIVSHNGRKEVVELLLTKGASIDLAMNDGRTPLYIASQEGKKEVVELLIEKGAAIDLAMNNGITPLYAASYNGHKEVVELLIEKGAAIDLAQKDGVTPLSIASHNGHEEVVELLLRYGASTDLVNKDGIRPLHIASQNGHKEVVELLLTKGANIDRATNDGRTPLYAASANGHNALVELLIEKGASVDLAMNDGRTPLYIASQKGKKEVVELLIEKGAAIDLADKNGAMPLYIASHNGHEEVVELLIEKGAAIDLAMNDGRTPLYIASQKGKKEVVELLLSKGAKIQGFKWFFTHSKDDFVKNIVSHVLDINNTSSLFSGEFLLKEKNIDLYIKLSNSLPFSFMLKNFCKIPLHNYYQYNSFHLAVMQDSTDSLKKLLFNRDIFYFVNSIDNKEKETCLEFARSRDRLEHIKVLLSFAISPIYVKYGFLINTTINLLDNPEIREYIANKIIFQAIKESRIENAAELLNVLSNENNHSSYKSIINLKALDNEGNNVFHALANHTNSIKIISSDNKINVEHFLNRCLAKLENGTYEITSFSEELIFAYNNLGLTPFHCAILYSNEDFVEYFLTNEKIKREGVTKLTRDGKSIFELIENNSVSKEVVTLLIKHLWSDKDIESFYQLAKVSEKDKGIYKAIKEGRGDLIKAFKISKKDITRMINLSINLNAFNCLKELMSFKTKEEIKPLFSTEFLFKICKENKPEILDILIKLDEEKLVEKGEEGNTLLHKACLMNREEIVMHLVGYREVFKMNGREIVQEIKGYDSVRKNINLQNEQGNTAMHNAHMALLPSLIYILSKAGADPHIKNKIGKRAIDLIEDIPKLSQEEGIRIGTINAALCALLNREYDGEYRLTLHLAILAKEDWIINDSSSIGLINEVDEEGNTALHLAVREDRVESVKRLLAIGANFSLKNKLEETTLELTRSKDVLMLLINSALKKNMVSEYILNIQNGIGNTLLHLAIQRAKVRKIEVEARTQMGDTKKEIKEEIELIDKHLIEALLDNGASKDKINRKAKTPIDLARKSKMLEEFLLGYEPKLSIMQNRETSYFKEKAEKDKKKQIDEQEEREVIEVLNEKRSQYQKLCTGRMPIHIIVERNDAFALDRLLSKEFDLKRLLDVEWLDNENKNCYEIAVNSFKVDVFKVLVNKAMIFDIFKETDNHASPIYLAVEKGDQFFKAVFERLKKEYEEGKFEIHKLRNDKQQEYKIREMKKDPITEILKKDSEEMLEKMMEIGLKIVDEDGNNLVTEAINKGARKIFKSLVSKVDNPEVFLRQYRQKKVAIEKAQEQYITIQDNFYLKAIRERLEKMQNGKEYFYILYEKVDTQEAIKVFEVLNGKRAHFESVSDRRKAIHFLTEYKDVLGLKSVLAMGSDPEWEDGNGDNCYEIAINSADMLSSLECFKILLDHLSKNKSLIFETEKHPSILWLVLEKRERITRDKLLEVVLKKMKKEYEDKRFTFEDMRKLKSDPIGRIIEKDDKEALEKLIGIGLKVAEMQSNLLEEARIKESSKIVDYLTRTFGTEVFKT